jgi:hypothetical protein
VEDTVSDPGTLVGSQQLKQRLSYVEQINKSRFAPDQVPNASAQQLRGNLKPGHKGTEKFSRINYKAIRRACKFGIGMVATGLSPDFPLAKIHFILDGLNLEAIAKKDLSVNGGTDHFQPITSSELRYAFRHWASLKNKMLFYVNLTKVDAPWESDWEKQDIFGKKPVKASKNVWTSYQARRASKTSYDPTKKPF